MSGLEIVGGIGAILSVIASVTKLAKGLNDVRSQYDRVALNTTLVASQLSTIRAALEALYEWRANDKTSTDASIQLDKDLGVSLSCCAILITVIEGKLGESGYTPGMKQKIKYVWLEDILKEYISNLEGQVRALQLLLTIFQCKTATEQKRRLQRAESRRIMEHVYAETASLRTDNKDFEDSASVLSLDPSVNFDVDSILMKSPAYQRVYGEVGPTRRIVRGIADHSSLQTRPKLPPRISDIPPTPPLKRHTEPASRASRTPHTPPSQPLSELPVRASNTPRTTPPEPRSELPARVSDAIRTFPLQPSCELEARTSDPPPIPQRPPPRARKRIDGWDSSRPKDHDNAAPMVDSKAVFELPTEPHRTRNTSQTTKKPLGTSAILPQSEELPTGPQHKTMATMTASSSGDVSTVYPHSARTKLIANMNKYADENEPASARDSLRNQIGTYIDEKLQTQITEEELGLSSDVTTSKIKTEQENKEFNSNPQTDSGLDVSTEGIHREQERRPISTHSSLYDASVRASPRQEEPGSTPDSDQGSVDLPNMLVTNELEAKTPESCPPGSHNANQRQQVSQKQSRTTSEASTTPRSDEASVQQWPNFSSSKLDTSAVTVYAEYQGRHTDPDTTRDRSATNEANIHTANTQPGETNNSRLHLSSHSTIATETEADHGIVRSIPSIIPKFDFLVPPSRIPPLPPVPSHPNHGLDLIAASEARSTVADSSTASSERDSSTYETPSTISSADQTEERTIFSPQQSVSNTTATSLSIPPQEAYRGQAQSDLRRLQNELATAKARGDSRAAQLPL